MSIHNDFLAIIPARAGSKGIKEKNIQLIGNKPMIQYTIEAALEIFSIENILISSNDQKVLNIAEAIGLKIPFVRPNELSTDTADTADVIMHSLEWFYSEYKKYPKNFLLLQPTSPFRSSKDIISAINLFNQSDSKTLISASDPIQHPGDFITKTKDGIFERVDIGRGKSDRQSYPEALFIDGGIYISETNYFIKTKDLIGEKPEIYKPEQFNAIDIDSPFDLELARAIYSFKKSNG